MSTGEPQGPKPVCQLVLTLMENGDLHIGGDADVEIVPALLHLALATVPGQAATHYLKRMKKAQRADLAVVRTLPAGLEGGGSHA